MNISCPKCETVFALQETLYQQGKKARCSVCANVFELNDSVIWKEEVFLSGQDHFATGTTVSSSASSAKFDTENEFKTSPTYQAPQQKGWGRTFWLFLLLCLAGVAAFAYYWHILSPQGVETALQEKPTLSNATAATPWLAGTPETPDTKTVDLEEPIAAVDVVESPSKGDAPVETETAVPAPEDLPEVSPAIETRDSVLPPANATVAATDGGEHSGTANSLLPAASTELPATSTENDLEQLRSAGQSQVNKKSKGISQPKKSTGRLMYPAELEHFKFRDVKQLSVHNDATDSDLMVLEGNIYNSLDAPRYVIVEGLLLDKNGDVLVSQKQIAGRSLSLLQIRQLTKEELEAFSLFDDATVNSGKAIAPKSLGAFVFIFSNLPDGVVECEVRPVEVFSIPQ